MSSLTKKRILDAAEEILLCKGFHSVGLSEILTAVNVPKGSFYHHFESKEQFGVEVIRHYATEHLTRLQKFFGSADRTGLQRFGDFWSYVIGQMTEQGCQQCCILVKMGLEVANFSEPMREALSAGMKASRETFAAAVRDGQEDGSIEADLDPADTAAAVQYTWHGALQAALVERSVAPLRSAAEFLNRCLRTN